MKRAVLFFCAFALAVFPGSVASAQKVHVEKAFDLPSGGACMVAGADAYLTDASGKIISAKYKWIDIPDENGLMKVDAGGSYGFINTDGTVVIQPKYEYISDFDANGLAVVGDGCKIVDGKPVGGRYGYMGNDGKFVVPVEFDFIGEFDENGVCWVNKGGNRFESDKNVELQMEAVARREKNPASIARKRDELEDAVTTGRRDVFAEKVKGGLHGLYSIDGHQLCPVEYQRIDPFMGGICRVQKKNLYGFLDVKGHEVVSCAYIDAAKSFNDGIAWVEALNKKAKLYGYVKDDGTALTECVYHSATDFKDGLAVVSELPEYVKGGPVPKTKYGLLGKDGKLVDGMKYDGVYMHAENMMFCSLGGRYLAVNSAGKEVTANVIITAKPYKNGRAIVKVSATDAAASPRGSVLQKGVAGDPKDKPVWLMIDSDGVVLSKGYANIRKETDGYYAVQSGKWGFIDNDGIERVPVEYDDVDAAFAGMASVKDASGKWGVLEIAGQMAVPFKYDGMMPVMVEGVIPVRLGTKWGGVNVKDELIVPFEMDYKEDVANMSALLCPENPGKPLSNFDVSRYAARKKAHTSRFNITDVISEEYWDF